MQRLLSSKTSFFSSSGTSCSEERALLAKQLLNHRLARLSSGGQLPPWVAGTEQSWFSQRCCGRSHRDIADTCAQARTPRQALPRALLDPQPFQHLFHITFLIFQALWAHSILSQMFPTSTSLPGMNNHNNTKERVQMVWFWDKLFVRDVCKALQPNAQTTNRD